MNDTQDPRVIAEALANPFPPDVVRFRAGATTKTGEKALALAYIDARIVMNRLDDVLGFQNWKDEYDVLADGAVRCTLTIRVGEEWIPKQDVGGQSEQSDEGDRMKAAFSDALKRAAVKFGIGRYLYDLPQSWVSYDPQRKQLKAHPELPSWAQPAEAAPVNPERKINAEELADVTRIMQQAEDAGLAKSLEAFWGWLKQAGAERLEDMPAKFYPVAVKGLQAKIDAKKGKGAA